MPGQLISAFGVALIAVFWAYDGWVYITWVSGEVKEPRRNVPLAMVLGVIVVGVIYMAMNMTYVYALPLSEVAKHETIAHAAATASVFSGGSVMAFGADRCLLFRRDGQLHHERRPRLLRHGARRCLLPEDGAGSSQVAHAGIQPDRTGNLGRDFDGQRPLRSG